MGWTGTTFKWKVGNTLYISIPFTWDLPRVQKYLYSYQPKFYDKIVIGGPAVQLMPEYLKLPSNVEIKYSMDNVLQIVNKKATRTTVGCPRKCKFCGIGKGLINKNYTELRDFPVLPIVCDDNFLASSRKHFDYVIDRLKGLKEKIDFNQGLDARLLKSYHIDRFSELKKPVMRFAWDHIGFEKHVLKAIEMCKKKGMRDIRCYVLIGFEDTPEDAQYRLETLNKLEVITNPMRYNPLYSLKRNTFIDDNWSHSELDRFMLYWFTPALRRKMKFNDFSRKEWKRFYDKNRMKNRNKFF